MRSRAAELHGHAKSKDSSIGLDPWTAARSSWIDAIATQSHLHVDAVAAPPRLYGVSRSTSCRCTSTAFLDRRRRCAVGSPGRRPPPNQESTALCQLHPSCRCSHSAGGC